MGGPHRQRSGRSTGRNVLPRNTDRVKVLITVIAAVTLTLALAVGATVGTAVYDSHHQRYVQQARPRHIATATLLEGASPDGVRATWSVGGVEHIGRLGGIRTAHAGDRVESWVDQDGNEIGAPTPTWRAGTDTVAVGYVACVGVMIWTGLLLTSVAERLARAR